MKSSDSKTFNTKGVQIPNHVAIIPDGNRRWARARGLYTLQGHKKGFDNAVKLCKAARKMGIHTMTIWGFSTENWDRSEQEVGYLMKLYARLIQQFLTEAEKEGVRLIHLGRKDRLPKTLINKLQSAETKTAKNTKHVINIAIDYGGQDEIIRAIQKMLKDGQDLNKLDGKVFEKYLDTWGQPYPFVDLMIRTSGEQRTSGLLLWQATYAEMYWEQDHFPDFTPEKLWSAILDFSRRRRRFGGDDKVKHLTFEPKMAANLEVKWWRLQNIPEETRFRDYAIQHLREQFGLSKKLTFEAAELFVEALIQGKKGKWQLALKKLKAFYVLIRNELKLPFEPQLVASLEVKLWQETGSKKSIENLRDAEDVAREYYAEVYRVSLLQAAKAAHLRMLAVVERNLAQKGLGEHHWQKAENYLEKFYAALRERVA